MINWAFLNKGNLNGKGLLCKPMSSNWIFDSGVTDTMTVDPQDLLSTGPTTRTHVQTASGESINVDQAGLVDISPSIRLKNCLIIPSLSHKLFFISQLTKKLNCKVLMTSSNCIMSDAHTGVIIECGTERGGLCYVVEAGHKGHTLLARGSPDHQLRIWHKCLGHP